MSVNETLCCCEYENQKGERSHLLACCCDCEALDHIADRCFKCEHVPTSAFDDLLDTLSDRCRIPWINGDGAKQISIEVATPIVIIPVSLCLAAVGPKLTCVVLLILPYFCFFFYRTWKRRTKRLRTKFFFSWGLASVIYLYTFFELVVCRFANVTLWQNLTLSVFMVAMLTSLMYAKRDPGITKSDKVKQYIEESFGSRRTIETKVSFRVGDDMDSEIEQGFEVIEHSDVEKIIHETKSPLERANHCTSCGTEKPERVGHCSVCDVCVRNRDHHCVWIDSCIGADNHRSFLIAMIMFVLVGYYGSYLTLTSVCDPAFPHDVMCPLYVAYRDFKWGLCYAGAWYVFMVASVMCVGLIHQVILISQNATSQELHAASVSGRTKFWLFVVNNPYNKGLVQNWVDFFNKQRSRQKYQIV